MNCRELEALLHPYLDGELDAAQRRDVDAHLSGCPACSRQLQDFRTLSAALKSPELRYPAGDLLKQRLKFQLREAAGRPARPRWPRFAAAAAVTLVALAVGWGVQHHEAEEQDDAMVEAVVDQQADAVSHGHPTDFASSDPAAVGAWFKGKLAYAPPVPDLSAQGFALVGARLEKVEDQSAAAVVYQRDGEYLTVFVCAATESGDTDLDEDTEDDYHVAYWTQGTLSFWVVSKLDPKAVRRAGEELRRAG